MNLRDVVTFIVTDASVDTTGLNSLITAIKERQRINRANTKAIAKATLNLGDTVSISGIRPKYLNGVIGKIKSFSPQRSHANIEVINTQGDHRVGASQYGIPIQCLTVVNAVAGVHPIDSTVLDFLEGEEFNGMHRDAN